MILTPLFDLSILSNVYGNDVDEDISIADESGGGCTNSTFGCTINAGTYSFHTVWFVCVYLLLLVVFSGGRLYVMCWDVCIAARGLWSFSFPFTNHHIISFILFL